jgi:Spy/CpxP family protein refolding chaperone
MKIDKVKVLTTLVVVLLLINITTLATIWKMRTPGGMEMHPPSPKEFIISKLNLDEEQQKVFEELRKEHFEQMRGLQEQIRAEKDAMYDLLKSSEPDTTQTYQHIAKIMQSEEQLERITFEHFRKVRAICNEEQQQHFDAIIDQIMRMVMRPPRPGGPNGPPREHGGGHPPHEHNMPLP